MDDARAQGGPEQTLTKEGGRLLRVLLLAPAAYALAYDRTFPFDVFYETQTPIVLGLLDLAYVAMRKGNHAI